MTNTETGPHHDAEGVAMDSEGLGLGADGDGLGLEGRVVIVTGTGNGWAEAMRTIWPDGEHPLSSTTSAARPTALPAGLRLATPCPAWNRDGAHPW